MKTLFDIVGAAMKTARDESIVRPRALKGFSREDLICVPFDPAPGVLLAQIRKKAKRERRLGGSSVFLLPKAAVLYGCLGAPAAVAALELLLASGVRRVLLLSFCGSLDPAIRIGDVVSVTGAISDEGTSARYLRRRSSFPSSPRLRRTAEARLQAVRFPLARATCVSTDAPYRETTAWLESMRRKGAGVVDMEASAVFALAEFRGVEAAAVMIVTDELFTGRWNVARRAGPIGERIRTCFVPFL
jgi:uridine phosphorylase